MITINFTTAQWISLALMIFALLANISSAIMSIRLGRRRSKLLDERAKLLDEGFDQIKQLKDDYHNMQPEAIAERARAHIISGIAGNIDVLERVENDLHYLHDSYHTATAHPDDCPICSSTQPQLEKLIADLKRVRVEVGVEKPDAE